MTIQILFTLFASSHRVQQLILSRIHDKMETDAIKADDKHERMENSSTYGSVIIENDVRLKKEVGLIGGISIIVGTIIGSGIFISPKGVLQMTGSVGLSLIIWTASGLLALLGAICYSELGTLVKKSGGEYAYIMEALGPAPAFLYAWTSITVVRTSSIAIISLTFAEYLVDLLPICGYSETAVKVTAVATIFTLMVCNCYSVRLASRLQIAFTFTKLLALGIIVVGGIVRLGLGYTGQFKNSCEGSETSFSTIAVAFYQALWAYDGWNNLNYVTEEIDQPEKNVPRANIAAISIVIVIYLLTNVSYLTAMSPMELLESNAVAVTWGDRVLKGASIILPIAVLFSTYGAAMGDSFTGGRVVYVAGREGHLPELLSFVHVKRFTPVPSMVYTCTVAMAMIGISNIESLVDIFSFTVWLFYGAAVLSLLIMRYTKRDEHRVIKVPLLIPIVFLFCAIFLVTGPIVGNPKIEFLYATLFILGGLIFYVPLVHLKLIQIDRITMFFQLLFEVAPSAYLPSE